MPQTVREPSRVQGTRTRGVTMIMMKTIVLIDRKGHEADRLRAIPHPNTKQSWIYHNGKWWGFGVGKLNGEQHYYEAEPETPPMGNMAEAMRSCENMAKGRTSW